MFLRTISLLCFVAFVAKTTTGQRPQYSGPRGRPQDMNRPPQQQGQPQNQGQPRNQGQPQNPQNPQGNPRSNQNPGNQQPPNQPQEARNPSNQGAEPRPNQPMLISEEFAKNLVDWHNNLRMKPNASNMVRMEWNDELVASARLAGNLCTCRV